jgi:hypothetical protein
VRVDDRYPFLDRPSSMHGVGRVVAIEAAFAGGDVGARIVSPFSMQSSTSATPFTIHVDTPGMHHFGAVRSTRPPAKSHHSTSSRACTGALVGSGALRTRRRGVRAETSRLVRADRPQRVGERSCDSAPPSGSASGPRSFASSREALGERGDLDHGTAEAGRR